MAATGPDTDDSREISGGMVPGTEGLAAFTLSAANPSSLPVLIAVPHAGRAYPASLIDRLRHPVDAPLRLEDRLVDQVAIAVAQATGASLLVAHAPRAMIDLNRAPDDVDWEMFGRRGGGDVGSYTPGRRSRSGLGLIPRRLPGLGELWKRRHEEADLAARIDLVHEPYHACLAQELATLRDRWGAALLIDMHSMPSLARSLGQPAAEFVLGDRFGASCHGMLVAGAFAYLADQGRLAAHNRPYAGGYVLDRHAAPALGLHALQIEIDRASYLDSRMVDAGGGFAGVVNLLAGLVERLAAEVSALAGVNGSGAADDPGRWAEAAE